MTSFNPFREHFYATYKIIFRRCRGRVRVWSGSERTTERTGGTRTDASFEKHADEMQMKCRWWHETRCITRTKCKTTDKNPTTEEIINHIAGNGKSRSYEYGKLYPGRYNTPPLREDLVPRSRMAPEGKRKRKRRGKLSCFFDKRVKPENLETVKPFREKKRRWTKLKTLR